MKHTEAQIVDILAATAGGVTTAVEVCRIHGISEQTFYRWKRCYGQMTTADVKHMRELESENACLRHMLVERDLEIDALRGLLRD